MKKILTLIILAFTLQSSFSQTLAQYEEKAAEAFAAENWSKALKYNEILIEIDSTRNDARFQGGLCAHNMRSYIKANELLSGIPNESRIGDYARTSFLLGNINKGLEDYANAIANYSHFIDQNPSGLSTELARATLELDYSEWALEQKSNPMNVNIIHLGDNINTVYSDISPFVEGDYLYYATLLTKGDYKDKERIKTLRAVNDLNPLPIATTEEERFVNSANYEMNDTGDRIVYTLCNEGGNKGYDCEIFQILKNSNGNWGERQRLGDKVNMPGYNNTQPALGRDAESGMELLFFSSNRPGGEGGMDIWCSVITENEDISVPVNIAEVNSDLDDITPSFLNASQTLYFASTGFQGMGGFDIFSSQKNNNDWGEATNLGYPINSGYDDIYYTFDTASGSAHYSSNRPGALCADPEKDCVTYDIYRIPMTVDLEVLTYNEVDNSDLLGTRVELYNLTTNIVDSFYINETTNHFAFPLQLGMDYRITGSKEGYSSATTEITTKGITTTTTLKEILVLAPTITLEVLTYDKVSGLPLNGTTVTFTDITANDITTSINPNTSYKCDYVLNFGKEYSVSAEKIGYTGSGLLTFDTRGISTPTKITKELYLQPFTGLPITLYFDNDYPNPSTTLDDCDKTYGKTFERYITQKENFMTNFSAGLSAEEQIFAQQDVASFFDNEVQVGYDKLMKFSNTLIKYFESGTIDTIEIEVQGYASPLAANDYNKHLTSRRVDSVVNHFEKFNGGVLLPYIQNNRIKFVEKPNGEELSKPGISPDYNNPRQSVFNPNASRERRVRILDIRRKDGFLSDAGY